MTKKKTQTSKGPISDLPNSLDDLFAEAVEAVESVGDESKPTKAESERDIFSSDDDDSIDFSEDEDFDFEVEIDIDDTPVSQTKDTKKRDRKKKDESSSMNLDDLFDESSDLPEEESSEDSSSEDENWKALYLEMEAKYKKAKRASAKRKKLLETLEQKHNTTRIELFQQRGFVEKVQDRLAQSQKQLRRYSSALGQANEKIEDMEERIENFEKGQSRQRNLLQKEREEQKKYGHGKPILKLISTLDNLKLALAHTDSEKEVFIEGVQLAVHKFENSLSKLGITTIEASLGTEFNPEFHEAMMKVPREDMPPNQIIDEIQSGFMIHDRLLRAARVSVSSRPKRNDRRSRRSKTEEPRVPEKQQENSTVPEVTLSESSPSEQIPEISRQEENKEIIHAEENQVEENESKEEFVSEDILEEVAEHVDVSQNADSSIEEKHPDITHSDENEESSIRGED